MKTFTIATGGSRTSKLWKNTTLNWATLVDRLENTHRTSETMGEYRNATKTQQDDIKDVGGFVGGEVINGTRKEVKHRHLLTLDVDFADEDFVDRFQLLTLYKHIVYSTHKHTAEKPRLRLVFPLHRPCEVEEYEPMARWIAKEIGIDFFDDSTYQAQRLMYWPSTSLDGEYLFTAEEGEEINIDEVLANYTNWKDISSWPVSSRAIKKHQSLLKKQEDPKEKAGVIGAFCKLYDVPKLIEEILQDVYTPCGENRYTYTEGTTVGGAVAYHDGDFLYSNHASDPASNQLCNSFDLLRIHKFGHLDVEESKKGKSLPSYQKSLEFIRQNHKVKALLHKARQEEIKSEFAGIEPLEEEDTEWLSKLTFDNKGNAISSIDNVKMVVLHDLNLKNKVIYDEFQERYQVRKRLPWDKEFEVRDWSSDDDAGLRHYMEISYQIKGKHFILDGWLLAVKENSVHPLRDYLKGLTWDGVERAENIFIDYLGAKDTLYTRNVTRKTLLACICRVFHPGCKHDTMVTLVGPQGVGKSLILKRLGGDFFTDTLNSVNDKSAYEQIQGFWIVEIAELAAMKKAEVEQVKHFISKTEDNYRGAYASRTARRKRKCVFFGTTNTHEYLKDMTGNRRHYPIDIGLAEPEKGSVYETFTTEIVDQVWAEIMTYYKKKEPRWIEDKEVQKLAEKEQDKHLEYNPLQGDITGFLDLDLPQNWDSMPLFERRNYINSGEAAEKCIKRNKICIMEVWCELLCSEKKDCTRAKSNEIKEIILKTGQWEKAEKVKKTKLYGSQVVFIRKK